MPIRDLIEPKILHQLAQLYGLHLERPEPEEMAPGEMDKPGPGGENISHKEYEKLMRHDSYRRERGAIRQCGWE